MKIFSNFDTELDNQLYKEAKERFGDERVLFVRRDKVYLVLKVRIPLTVWFIISSILLLSYYVYLSGGGFMQYVGGFLWFIVVISGIYVIYKGSLKFIDFHMDYTIITPLSVMQYDQTGVLGRSTRSLDISKIRSISIDKQGLLKSLFNYGSIVFFSEGDASFGDITLNYISNPISLRDSIEHIIMLHTSLKEDFVDDVKSNNQVNEKIASQTPESNSEVTVKPVFEKTTENNDNSNSNDNNSNDNKKNNNNDNNKSHAENADESPIYHSDVDPDQLSEKLTEKNEHDIARNDGSDKTESTSKNTSSN